MNVLMIGNSFSHYNRMNRSNGILYQIADAAGQKIAITPVYSGGYYLHQFLDPTDPYGEQVELLLNSNIPYDAVILQEQSSNPLRHTDDFRQSVEKFKSMTDAKLLLFASWGYHDHHEKISDYGGSTYEMTNRLHNAFQSVGEEFGADVAHVGSAWLDIYTNQSQIPLYMQDYKHPSLQGSVLAAWVLFGKLFGMDPKLESFQYGLAPDEAGLLREAASRVL